MRSDVKMTAAIDRPIGAGFGGTMARPGGYMARRAVGWLSWAVVLLALLGYGLYLALGLSSPMVSGLAAFSPTMQFGCLGRWPMRSSAR